MFATLGVLFAGLIGLARGGGNPIRSNQLMRWRVILQGAALLLFILAVPVFLYFAQPLGKIFSRRNEFAADEFATRHAQAKDLVQALVKLYKDNAATLTPDPVHSAFYDSHPPAAARIARLTPA